MILIAILAIGFHLASLWGAVQYFRSGTCRNADRSIVAAMAVGSLALAAIQGGQVFSQFFSWAGYTPLDSFLSAFTLFNGVMYQSIIHSYSETREHRCSIRPNPRGTPQ
jgi:hypothetical protein